MPEISIIVPVYKVEKYLRQCLDSIKTQTFENWECILVDDGSPDGCGEICEEFAAADSRFKVIHRENGGLSAARNSGLEVARAPYIGFVDSDDWIESKMYETLLALIKEYDADMVEGSIVNEYTTFSRKKRYVRRDKVLDSRGIAKELYRDKILPNYVWNKLFRREVIDTPFPEGKVFEDIHAMNAWVKNLGKVVISPEIVYHYRRRRGSILTSNYSENRIEYLKAIEERANVLQEYEPDALTFNQRSAYLFTGAINAAKTIARNEPDEKVRNEALQVISDMTEYYSYPPFWQLGPKKFYRAIKLMDYPQKFGELMRKVYKADLQSHHRAASLFD